MRLGSDVHGGRCALAAVYYGLRARIGVDVDICNCTKRRKEEVRAAGSEGRPYVGRVWSPACTLL